MTDSSVKTKDEFLNAKAYLETVRQIVTSNANHFINVTIAPEQQDLKEATDLLLSINGEKMALRVREAKYLRYTDITIRSYNQGFKTEYDKIKESPVRWYLYAWVDANKKIVRWYLVDMQKGRDSGLFKVTRATRFNNDGGKTGFVTIALDELEKANCIVARFDATQKQPDYPAIIKGLQGKVAEMQTQIATYQMMEATVKRISGELSAVIAKPKVNDHGGGESKSGGQ